MINLSVCSAMGVPILFRARNPEYVFSIMESTDRIRETVPGKILWSAKHFAFCFKDSPVATMPGAPTREDVKDLVKTGRELFPPGATTSALIHCSSGMSRSPAAAFIFFCIHFGSNREEQAAVRTTICCEQNIVVPNKLMIEYADELLHRNGEMLKQRDTFG